MKDLDFDELDRAVNSLMTNVSKTEPSKDEDHIKTLDITPTLAPGAVPEFNNLAAPSSSAAPTTPAVKVSEPSSLVVSSSSARPASPSVAARRGGRFMDVVHPSSDMKPRPAPISPQSRQGITITPTQSSLSEPEPAAAETPAAFVPEPGATLDSTPSAQPAMTEDRTTPTNEWPDPLDMVNFDKTSPSQPDEPAVAKPTETPLEKEPEIETPVPPSKKDEAETPLTTPFLTGTKVEKRPLGGSAPSIGEEPGRTPVFASSALNTGSVNDPDDQLPALPKDVEPILPAELQRDLMEIEADTSANVHAPEETRPPADDRAAAKAKGDDEPSSKPTASTALKPEASAIISGPTSIPQQYREEPNTGEATSGAIYDTDTYHQPLSHPAKKKSGWLWVVWILLIVLVGAGIGAALFFFGVV